MRKFLLGCVVAAAAISSSSASAEVTQLNVPLGAGGFGFLPLHMMREHNLVEKHAEEAGIGLTVNWANVGGPAAMNDALLSGSAHFISAGPPGFLTLWDRTRGNMDVKGAAAMSSMPMFLNTYAEHIQSLDDFSGNDRMGVTSVGVSIPSIIMQMYAQQQGESDVFKYDQYTVSMAHPDSAIALLTRSGGIIAHYASSPFHEIEMKDPGIRTIQNSDDVMGGSTTFTMISTTTQFYEENPTVYRVFLAALKDAQDMIEEDEDEAIRVLLASMGDRSELSNDELLEILNRDSTKYTTVPENVLKYGEFMHSIGSISNKPETLADIFFEVDEVAGGN